MRRIIVTLVVLTAICSVGAWYVSQTTQQKPQTMTNDPSCAFMLYGEICSNVPQGGGGCGMRCVYM